MPAIAILVTALRIFYSFDASPSPDIAGYECAFFMIEIKQVPCIGGEELCHTISKPVAIPCYINVSEKIDADFRATTVTPLPGQVIYGYLRSVNFNNIKSEWVWQQMLSKSESPSGGLQLIEGRSVENVN